MGKCGEEEGGRDCFDAGGTRVESGWMDKRSRARGREGKTVESVKRALNETPRRFEGKRRARGEREGTIGRTYDGLGNLSSSSGDGSGLLSDNSRSSSSLEGGWIAGEGRKEEKRKEEESGTSRTTNPSPTPPSLSRPSF